MSTARETNSSLPGRETFTPSLYNLVRVSARGFKKSDISGFELPYHMPANSRFSFLILIVGGNSLMIMCKGQKENEEDLKTGTPSVLNCKDIFERTARKPLDTSS
jgi:hypothetical protein